MNRILPLLALLPGIILAVEPLEPRSAELTANRAMEVVVHRDVSTVLQFPAAVSMVVGEGLTGGEREGAVQFENPKGSRIIVLRALAIRDPILMHVMIGDEIYLFRLTGGEKPESLIRFGRPGEEGKGAEVEPGAILAQRLDLPPAKLRDLSDLARARAVMERKLPEHYAHSAWRGVSSVHNSARVRIEVTEIHRFERPDVLVLFATIKNTGRSDLDVEAAGMRIHVGLVRSYPPSLVGCDHTMLGPGAEGRLELILAGNGAGRREHLSIENEFHVTLAGEAPGPAPAPKLTDLTYYLD